MTLISSAAVTVVATTKAADIDFWGRVFIYVVVAAMFGLIGLIPEIAEKDRQRDAVRAAKTAPVWTVENAPTKAAPPAAGQLAHTAQTIDAEFAEIRQAPQLHGDDPRLGQ